MLRLNFIAVYTLSFFSVLAAGASPPANTQIGDSQMPHSAPKMISNPLVERAADPWVTRHNDAYYYCYSRRGGLWVNTARTLKEVLQRTGKCVWQPEEDKAYSEELWAPELHQIEGRWYIYFAADDGKNQNHRMYVLASKGPDPMGPYAFVGKLPSTPDKWAIDGTVLKHNGNFYFVWSGWEGDVDLSQELYIARIKSPTELEGERVQISSPEYDWERSVYPINEGPVALYHEGRTFLIFSADASWTDKYCLGQLELVGDDPLDPKCWKKKPTPVFSPTDKVFGPGHCSFIKSPDGTEDWIIYHSAQKSGSGWRRQGCAQRFGWKENGEPDFGTPLDLGVEFAPPSGE